LEDNINVSLWYNNKLSVISVFSRIIGVGNVTVTSEFNFFVDPEAAHVVLEGFDLCPIYLVPWETCLKFATSAHVRCNFADFVANNLFIVYWFQLANYFTSNYNDGVNYFFTDGSIIHNFFRGDEIIALI